MTLYHPRPERWPQFSLWGLLIVVTLAALLMPWVIVECQRARLRWRDLEALRAIDSNYCCHNDGIPIDEGRLEP